MTTFTLSPTLNKNRVFILQKSEIEMRIDPYFYIPKFKDLEAKLKTKRTKKISEIASKIFSGSTPLSKGDSYTDNPSEGIPFVRSGDFNIDGSIDFENLVYLKPEIHEKQLKSSQLKTNDLLFAIVGATIGKVGVYKSDRNANINQAICAVRIKEGFNIDFLNAYFQTSIGQGLIDRIKRPVARANINLDEIATLPIILPDEKTQKKIIDIFNLSLEQKKQNEAEAEELLASIDEYLLNELGIKLPKSAESTVKNRIFTTSINQLSENRFDPYYHQESFKQLDKILSSKLFSKFSSLIEVITKGETPLWKGETYVDEGIPFLKVQNISIDGIFGEITYITKELHDSMVRSKLQGGELLYTMAGSIGIATYLPKDFGEANINQAIAKIILKENISINKDYLLEVLNSYICNIQAKRFLTVSAQPNINFEQIKAIKIPLPPLEKQKEIAKHINSIREQARKLKEKTNGALASASQEIEAILLG
ncbi:MAG: restriction endonuclease subunit S [Anaerolineales bacterium]|nr:restriction endonuclease subunit S [Anaerolineales bacterium]